MKAGASTYDFGPSLGCKQPVAINMKIQKRRKMSLFTVLLCNRRVPAKITASRVHTKQHSSGKIMIGFRSRPQQLIKVTA